MLQSLVSKATSRPSFLQWVCSCKANFLCQRDVTLNSNKGGFLYTLLQTAFDCTVRLSTEHSIRNNNESAGFHAPIQLFLSCILFSFTCLFMCFSLYIPTKVSTSTRLPIFSPFHPHSFLLHCFSSAKDRDCMNSSQSWYIKLQGISR